ncbi:MULTISPECIES: hypothetical protein [unclassified Agrococcus]|uniref:hypothetical protein n=1 Tax=unclassified Agrococcus TaxID=2615065 RepID=UPI00360BA017
MRRGIHRPSTRDALRAEMLRIRGTRRLVGIALTAILATVASAATVALLVDALRPGPAEAAVVAVHRGSAAQVAIAVVVALLVGGDHRHGTATLAWMQLGGRRRLAIVAAVQAALAAAVALGSASAALAIVTGVAAAPMHAVPAVVAAHVGLMVVWSAWLACVATLTGSTLATLACGLVVPIAVEPVVSGLLAAAGASGVQRLLPTTALRMLGELAAGGERVVIAPASTSDAWLVPCVVVVWTCVLAALAWRRASRAP